MSMQPPSFDLHRHGSLLYTGTHSVRMALETGQHGAQSLEPPNLYMTNTSNSPQPPAPGDRIPEEFAQEVRKLVHDLSNALEIIVQTSYLLSAVEMKEPASDWLRMLDSGVQKGLDINLSLRSYTRGNTPE